MLSPSYSIYKGNQQYILVYAYCFGGIVGSIPFHTQERPRLDGKLYGPSTYRLEWDFLKRGHQAIAIRIT